MKYYKDTQNQIYAYESDGSQDAWIKPGLTSITEAEADELRKPPPLTPEQLVEQHRAEIIARLAEIDIASIRPLRAIADGTATDFDREKLAALEAEAEALRGELAEQGQTG
jgi:hypothetical protein